MKKVHLTDNGRTEDGRIVVGNVFQFIDTLGVPIHTVYDVLVSKNMVIDWDMFVTNAVAAGWNHSTIHSRVLDTLLKKEEKDRLAQYWDNK
jgi:alanyl-tRNA synthetase